MARQNKHEDSNVSLLEALDTLTSITDLELEEEGGIIEEEDLVVQDNKLYYRTFEWQGHGDEITPHELVKKTFGSILKYLRGLARQNHGFVTDKERIEGIKSIMVLVGESARKLDRFTSLFHHTNIKRVSGLEEYKKLQDFYLTRIAHRVDTRMLGQWIYSLTQKTFPKEKIESNHLFVDLDSVKRDTEYELFFMRKNDGTRFFNPRLIKSMKLVCDFGDTIKQAASKVDDPLVDLAIWKDRSVQASAKNMVKDLAHHIDWYYKEAAHNKRRGVSVLLNKALMALMLSSHARNLLENEPIKCCSEYFVDFQFFLREVLHSREYQKNLVYPPKKSDHLGSHLMEMVHAICQSLFLSLDGYSEMSSILGDLIEEGKEMMSSEKGVSLSQNMLDGYLAMVEIAKLHSNGPLINVLEMLENGSGNSYDPLGQGNIPHVLFSYFLHDLKITHIRLPTPTKQEFVNKVELADEFIGFLLAEPKGREKQKVLIFNLQDRTSWKEHERCVLLEELQHHPDFKKKLSVVTLAKDTDFYRQDEPYTKDHQAKVFIQHFLEHLQDENAGFYFPKKVKKVLFPQMAEELMHAVHRIFFGERNVLSKDERLIFIELFYLFLEMKILEIVKPTCFSFTCKDAVDTGEAASAKLLAFLTLLSEEEIDKSVISQLELILHIPALLVRGRAMLPERFESFINVLKTLELEREEFGYENFKKIINEAFGSYYESSLVETKLV